MGVGMAKVNHIERKPALPGESQKKEDLEGFLMAHGFANLKDPALIHQLAYFVQNHKHFAEVLRAVPALQRNEAYEAMKPYLRFEAGPFYTYLLF